MESSARPIVLVVDDDRAIAEAVAAFLEDEGFATTCAGDGVEALDLLADTTALPSVILLDMMMPTMDGWTFCKIRQGVRALMAIPVIAVSAASMAGGREPLRVDATLAKPFDPDELVWLVTRMTGRKSFFERRPGRPAH
jgi:CheY-like chemotaxis protein